MQPIEHLDTIAAVAPCCGDVLKGTLPQSHLVQFYGADDHLINQNVGRFLAEGLVFGGALVIGSAERNAAVALKIHEFGIDAQQAQQEGRLRFLEAEQTLERFMVDGQPYWGRFEQTIGSVISEIRTNVGHGGLRAYGEMVGVLWTKGQLSAAVRLEQFWNKLLTHSSASLFCGYPIDIFSPGFESAAVDAVLRAHTHVVPSWSVGNAEDAIQEAMRNVLGPMAGEMETLMEAEPPGTRSGLRKAEARVRWIRQNLPDRADEILARARQFLQPSSVKL
jgi:MEDS: MEthanogen/methylotroph, DcmR Sensory domain